jgi:hypothetical protein
MKRKAITRRTPLRRKTPISSRITKYRRRMRDVSYMLWVRRQPCAARSLDESCYGRVQADHAGRRGMGRRADDRTCIPLCSKHHTQRDAFHGVFRSWGHEQMRLWLAMTVANTQRWYEQAHPSRG